MNPVEHQAAEPRTGGALRLVGGAPFDRSVIAIAVIVFMVFVGLPFLVALGELLLVLVLAVGGAIGRVLFRRPWTVDAVGPDGEHHQWSVVGWRASGAARRFVADRIAATGTAPTSDELAAAVLAP